MNKLFILTGGSGSGKTTILNQVSDNHVISFTTREPRQGEINGVDYLYISKDEYFDLLNSGGLIEWVEYGGNYYGLTKQEIETKLNKDHAFVIVDYHGKQQLEELYPDNVVSIFIYTKPEIAAERMNKRGDSIENVEKRMSTFKEELKNRDKYDYVVDNSYDIELAVGMVKFIIESEVSN